MASQLDCRTPTVALFTIWRWQACFLTFHQIFIGFLLISNSICMLRIFFSVTRCVASRHLVVWSTCLIVCSWSEDKILAKCSLVDDGQRGKNFGEFILLYL